MLSQVEFLQGLPARDYNNADVMNDLHLAQGGCIKMCMMGQREIDK